MAVGVVGAEGVMFSPDRGWGEGGKGGSII